MCKKCGHTWRIYKEGILPYKHYQEEIVREVVESGAVCEDCIAENSTQYRWLKEFLNGKTLMEVQREIAQKLPMMLVEPVTEDLYPLLSSYQILHPDTWFFRICIILNTNRLRVGLSPPAS